MEGQPPENPGTKDLNRPKSKYWKFVLGFFGVLIGVFLLYVAGYWAVKKYEAVQQARWAEQFVQGLREEQKKKYEAALKDVYGGKTPQETLQMYIDAVERGDYELASKYFALEKQGDELRSLQNSPRSNIENVLSLLKQDLGSQGGFSGDKKGFAIDKPILVDFILYPSGVWKITEI